MMKPGEYYIGDLCYVFSHDRDNWSIVCDTTFKDNLYDGEFEAEFPRKDGSGTEKIRFAIYSTAYGDGCYQGSTGAVYGVDAGSIGCIALEDLEKIEDIDRKEMLRLGNILTFDKKFSTGHDQNKIGGFGRPAIIFFGDLEVIDTDPEPEEEEDLYEEDDEDWRAEEYRWDDEDEKVVDEY